MSGRRGARVRRWRSVLTVATLALLGWGGALEAQEWLVQLPIDEGTHPTGDLFIEDLDAIWSATGEVLEDASILIRDGIIEEIGSGLSAPSGMEVVDGSGLTAIPGIVDEHSHIATEGGLNEGTSPVVPEVRVLDVLDPESFGIYRALTGGVTTARLMHGSSNPIGGQSAVIKTRWGMEEGRDLLLPGAPRAVKFALGENVTRKRRQDEPDWTWRYPASRPGVEGIYVQAFTAAQEYQRVWEEYRADPGAFPVPPRRDLRLEALVDIMEDRIHVHAHSYRSDEILSLMRVAERFGFRIEVFTHVLEGYKVASELREHGAAASTFSDWWQFKLEAYDAIPHNPTIMHEQGVLTGINSDIPWLQTFMNWEMQKPVRYGGASREDALRMLTLHPAQMMRIDEWVGSLEVGKHGDVALLTGDPFDSFSRVQATIIDGIVYYDFDEEEATRGEPFRPLAERVAALEAGPEGSGEGSSSGAPGSFSGGSVTPASPRARAGEDDVEAPTVALVGGTVHPVSGAPIEDGAVVLAGGRVQEVGPRDAVEVPEGADVVDVTGRHIYPGMIDPFTYLGLFEMGQIPQATDRVETGLLNPHLRAISAYQPHGRAVNVSRAAGITSVLTTQSYGVVSGKGGVVQLRGDTWERAEILGEAALVVDFPAPVVPPDEARVVEGGPEPALEGESMEKLVELFERARLYARTPSIEQAPDAPFEPQVWGGDRVALEAMVPVIEGEIPVFFRAGSEWQLRTLFHFLDRFPEVRGVVVGGSQAFRVADGLARRDLPVILTGTRTPTPDRDDPVAAAMQNPSILHAAGVRFAFGTDDSADVRTLPDHAAIAVAYGLEPEEGLRGVTLSAAEILGLGAEMGSLDPGKRADVIVTDGNPLQILTQVERMWVGGHEVDPRDNAHDRLHLQFRDRP